MPKKKAQHLVIVESPTKARTISKFLGGDFRVESSFGHIRDLPKSKMGVDLEHDFQPQYIIPTRNKKRVTELKKIAKAADDIYFATDEDREGEAISWHLCEVLEIPVKDAKRIVFHEITPRALEEALKKPRAINTHLVDAQQARRVLDRLVGYELSPFLWRKITKGLSAGRVQSVAVRLIVEREREIQAFTAEEYWTIEIDVHTETGDTQSFRARLNKKNNETLDKFAITKEEDAQSLVADVQSAQFSIGEVTKKEVKKSPYPPFITSSLQQEANRRLRFSTKQTMTIAQQLYEGIETGNGSEGLITYMRTDSVNLSTVFLAECQEYIKEKLGDAYAGPVRTYKTKSKLAQEAHEAIRPTSAFRTPESVKDYLDEGQYKLYDLIWRRAVASQLPDARYEATTIDVLASGEQKYVFRATGQTVLFDGFANIYQLDSEEVLLPQCQTGASVILENIEPLQHFTKPPARYSEAGLVKALEEHGIGRPSTYSPTISTIIERNYVQREERRLKPTELAFVVNDLLVEHFNSIVDYAFTAHMEDDLDQIAEGEKKWVPVVKDFYSPFKQNLDEKDKELSKQTLAVEETDEICEKCGKPMVIRLGRFGKFLACTGFPECKNARPLPGTEEQDSQGSAEVEPCEKCGGPMVLKQGRFGKFYGCSKYPDCKNIRNIRDKKLDIPCPTCGKGMVVQRRSKRGKTFYGCTLYPECDYVSWTRPGEEQMAQK